MDVILNVFFDMDFEEFTVINPPIIPLIGEFISFYWSDFVADEKQIKRLKEFESEESFVVGHIWKKIYRDKIEVNITIFSQAEYIKTQNFKKTQTD